MSEFLFADDIFQNVRVIDNNLISFEKLDRTPTKKQRAIKQRIFWILKTGYISPLLAVIGMIHEKINRPFGNFLIFFTSKVNICN